MARKEKKNRRDPSKTKKVRRIVSKRKKGTLKWKNLENKLKKALNSIRSKPTSKKKNAFVKVINDIGKGIKNGRIKLSPEKQKALKGIVGEFAELTGEKEKVISEFKQKSMKLKNEIKNQKAKQKTQQDSKKLEKLKKTDEILEEMLRKLGGTASKEKKSSRMPLELVDEIGFEAGQPKRREENFREALTGMDAKSRGRINYEEKMKAIKELKKANIKAENIEMKNKYSEVLSELSEARQKFEETKKKYEFRKKQNPKLTEKELLKGTPEGEAFAEAKRMLKVRQEQEEWLKSKLSKGKKLVKKRTEPTKTGRGLLDSAFGRKKPNMIKSVKRKRDGRLKKDTRRRLDPGRLYDEVRLDLSNAIDRLDRAQQSYKSRKEITPNQEKKSLMKGTEEGRELHKARERVRALKRAKENLRLKLERGETLEDLWIDDYQERKGKEHKNLPVEYRGGVPAESGERLPIKKVISDRKLKGAGDLINLFEKGGLKEKLGVNSTIIEKMKKRWNADILSSAQEKMKKGDYYNLTDKEKSTVKSFFNALGVDVAFDTGMSPFTKAGETPISREASSRRATKKKPNLPVEYRGGVPAEYKEGKLIEYKRGEIIEKEGERLPIETGISDRRVSDRKPKGVKLSFFGVPILKERETQVGRAKRVREEEIPWLEGGLEEQRRRAIDAEEWQLGKEPRRNLRVLKGETPEAEGKKEKPFMYRVAEKDKERGRVTSTGRGGGGSAAAEKKEKEEKAKKSGGGTGGGGSLGEGHNWTIQEIIGVIIFLLFIIGVMYVVSLF